MLMQAKTPPKLPPERSDISASLQGPFGIKAGWKPPIRLGKGHPSCVAEITPELRHAITAWAFVARPWQEAGIDVLNLTGFRTREGFLQGRGTSVKVGTCAGSFACLPGVLVLDLKVTGVAAVQVRDQDGHLAQEGFRVAVALAAVLVLAGVQVGVEQQVPGVSLDQPERVEVAVKDEKPTPYHMDLLRKALQARIEASGGPVPEGSCLNGVAKT
jgi:hypothetical protein